LQLDEEIDEKIQNRLKIKFKDVNNFSNEKLDSFVSTFSSKKFFYEKFFLMHEKKNFPLQILISHAHVNENIAKIVSPFANNPLGLSMTLIIFGPILLGWNNLSLCIPRETFKGSNISSFVLETGKSYNTSNVLRKVSDFVFEWNTTKTYSNFKANSQTFTHDLLKIFGLDFKGLINGQSNPLVQSQLTSFKKGSHDIVFVDPFTKKPVKIDNYDDLEDYYDSLVLLDPNFKVNYANEVDFLEQWGMSLFLRNLKTNVVPKTRNFRNPLKFWKP
jgi:hypothetical protein